MARRYDENAKTAGRSDAVSTTGHGPQLRFVCSGEDSVAASVCLTD